MPKRFLILTLLSCLAFPAEAPADKHDFEYAMALAKERQFYDLAEREFKQLMTSSDPNVAVRGKFGLAKILVYQAHREVDPAKRTKFYDQALDRIEEVVKGAGDELLEGRFDLGELLKEKAEFLLKRAEKEGDKAAALKDDARKAYDRAIEQFQTVADKLKAETDEDKKFLYRKARYYVIESKFEKGVTWPLGDSNRNSNLQGLKSEIESFCWDNESYVEAYFAYVILGQVHASLLTKKHPTATDLEESFQAFNAALAIPSTQMTERARTTAYWKFMEVCNQFKLYDKAIELAGKMAKDYPRVEDTTFGQGAVLEEAKAWYGKGETQKALAIAQRLAQRGGYFAYRAKLLIGSWNPQSIGPKEAKTSYLVGDGAFRERRWWDSLRAYQDTIQALDELAERAAQAPGADKAKLEAQLAEEKKAYLVDSWQKIGSCFRQLGLSYESYHALLQASREDLALGGAEARKAPEYAYLALGAIKRRWYVTKAASDDALCKEAMKYFLDNFSNSPYAPGIRILDARDLEEKGEFLAAVAAYEKIPQGEFYEEAVSRIGICYFREMSKKIAELEKAKQPIDDECKGLGRKALEAFDRYLKYTQDHKAADDASKAKREDLMGRVTYYRGSLHDRLGEHSQVLAVLLEFDKAYAKSGGDELIGAALWLRIKAQAALSDQAAGAKDDKEALARLTASEEELSKLKKAMPGSRFLLIAGYRLGMIHDAMFQQHEKASKDGPEPARKEAAEKALHHNQRAAEHLYEWALRYKPMAYDNLRFVAVKCMQLATGDDQAKYLQQAANLFSRLLAEHAGRAAKDKIHSFVAQCYIQTERWAEALEMVRHEFADNSRSLFAVETLGRCWYQIGEKPSADREAFKKLISGARREDLSLVGHFKKDEKLKRDLVFRASVLYEAAKQLDKPGYTMNEADFNKFQRDRLALEPGPLVQEYEQIVAAYFSRVLKRLESEYKTSREVQAGLGDFALDRALHFYRQLAMKVEKGKPHWWAAKYHVIACFLHKGKHKKALSEDAEPDAKKALFAEATALWKEADGTHGSLSSGVPEGDERKRWEEIKKEISSELGR